MRLSWTAEAHQDRRERRNYIATANPAAALALDEMFSRKARSLLDNPALGRPGRVAGTRELVVHRSYILIYDEVEDGIRILRVLHSRRRFPATS